MNEADTKRHENIPQDTIPMGQDYMRNLQETLRKNGVFGVQSVFYRNEILDALRRQGIATDSIYSPQDLKKETGYKSSFMLPQAFNQKPYAYNGAVQQPPKLESQTTIQKIEVNITNNGELDEKKVAELVGNEVGRQVPQHMFAIVQPRGGLFGNWG